MPNKPKKPPAFPLIAFLVGTLAIVAFAIAVVIVTYTEASPIAVLCWTFGGYCIALAVIVLVRTMQNRMKKTEFTEINRFFSEMSLELIQKLHLPTLICDKDGKIVWYNTILAKTVNIKGTLYGRFIDSICTTTLEGIRQKEKDETKELELSFVMTGELSDEHPDIFTAKSYPTTSRGKDYYIIVFENITKHKKLEKQLEDEDTIIAYAIIDNLDELMQYVQEMYSSAASEVGKLLQRYFEQIGGIVRNYGHNKFICAFAREHLTTLERERFSVLDDIREVYISETMLPVTISMGIAAIPGSLYEKERASQSALDMALQRGGDQVVVKTEDGFAYYGGKTKTVQKRTKVRARVIANKLLDYLAGAENVLIMGHKFPDFDAFASCMAILRLARFCGAEALIVTDRSAKSIAPCFKRLEGLAEYENVFIDRIEAQDMIRSGTLAVIVDVNNIDFCEAPDVANTVQDLIVIDHHRKTAEYKTEPRISYIEPSASSASELICEFLEQVIQPGTLPKVESDFLLAGMLLDTKMFTRNTGVKTFSAAMYLRGEGASPSDAQAFFKMDIDDFLSEASFESNVAVYKSTIAIALNERDDNSPAVRVNAARAADRLLNVEGIGAAFTLCRIGDTVFISARSQSKINVQLIVEKLGGGGHFDSAAAQLKNETVESASALLLEAIEAYCSENEALFNA